SGSGGARPITVTTAMRRPRRGRHLPATASSSASGSMGPHDAPIAEESQRELPPLPLRLLGQGLSLAIARAPWLWPVLRRPTRRFWERSAAGWDERIRPDREEHLAPLAAACDRSHGAPKTILEPGTGTGARALTL